MVKFYNQKVEEDLASDFVQENIKLLTMFARIKGLFTKLKQKVNEDKTDKEYDVGVPPTDDVLQAELQDKRSKVAEHLEPVKANWDFIESILLWKNALPACICFFLISGVFW